MKFFINLGVSERIYKATRKLTSCKISLSIPNYLEDERKHEKIKFVFQNLSKEDFKEDLLLCNVQLKQTSANSYRFVKKKTSSERCMYALLRSTGTIPDDIFIPAAMKDRVTVIRRMRFIDAEVDYGDFLSNVYLVKIHLKDDESLPVYLAYENPKILEEHYVFYKQSWNKKYEVSEKLKTFIILNKENKDEYVSLSSLCE